MDSQGIVWKILCVHCGSFVLVSVVKNLQQWTMFVPLLGMGEVTNGDDDIQVT